MDVQGQVHHTIKNIKSSSCHWYNHQLYVCDLENYQILVYNDKYHLVTSFGNSDVFTVPISVAIFNRQPQQQYDDEKNIEILVSDYCLDCIKVFDSKGSFLRGYGGTGSASGKFNRPREILIYQDVLYVCDSCNHRIQVLNPKDGEVIRVIGGARALGKQDGLFDTPHSLSIYDHFLYVVDTNNHRIQVLSLDGIFIRKFGTYGHDDAQFYYPTSVFVCEGPLMSDGSSAIRVLVVDNSNHRVQMLDETGSFLRSFGSKGTEKNQLLLPTALSYSNYVLAVCDTVNERIVFFQ